MAHCRRTSKSRNSSGSKELERPKDSFVYVRRLIEKRIKVPVLSSDRVKDLKAKIEKLEGIAASDQALDFGGIPLVDEAAKLSQYGIKNEDNLHVMEKTCTRGWIQLFVKGPVETFSIGICAQSTVMNLKKKIEEKIGLETNKQRLVFQGILLPDNLALASSEVKQGSTVKLYPARLNPVTVRTLSGTSHGVEVEDVDTSLILKEKVFKLFHVPPSAQNLILGENQLEDKKMMMDYGVKENSVVWMIPNKMETGEPISVVVVDSSKKKHRVETGSHITVLAFKKKVQVAEGTPVENQRLFLERGEDEDSEGARSIVYKEAKDSMCLTDAGIVDGAIVTLRVRLPLTLRVEQRYGCKKEHEIVVDANDKVSDLKTLIAKELYLGNDKLELYYDGDSLRDGRVISSYNIPNKGKIRAGYVVYEC